MLNFGNEAVAIGEWLVFFRSHFSDLWFIQRSRDRSTKVKICKFFNRQIPTTIRLISQCVANCVLALFTSSNIHWDDRVVVEWRNPFWGQKLTIFKRSQKNHLFCSGIIRPVSNGLEEKLFGMLSFRCGLLVKWRINGFLAFVNGVSMWIFELIKNITIQIEWVCC